MSTETNFSILGGCKFCACGEGSHEDFEVNTLDETSRGYGEDGNKLHDLPENCRSYT
jgi:hypothetical protein